MTTGPDDPTGAPGPRVHDSPVVRALLVTAGFASVALGVAGIFLPLLPTTPFLLLAAACYVRASARFYNWLLNTRTFGPMIINWRDHRAMALRHKVMAIGFIAVSIGVTVLFFMPHPAGQVSVGAREQQAAGQQRVTRRR